MQESSTPNPDRKEEDEGPGFEYDDRPIRDCVWLVLFVLLVLLTCGFAVYAGINKNDNSSHLFKGDYQRELSFCYDTETPAEPETATETQTVAGNAERSLDFYDRQLRTLKQSVPSAEELGAKLGNDSTFLEFLDHAWIWILAATGAAVVLGFIFVLLFSFMASVMVYGVAALLSTAPIAAGLLLLLVYEDNWGWAYIAAGVVVGVVLLCFHHQLTLTAKLLDLGADGIRDNLDLVFFSICVNLVLLAIITGLLCFGVLSLTNGTFDLAGGLNEDDLEKGECNSLFGGFQTDCCDWNFDNWVAGYWVLVIVMLIWFIFLINQIRVYVVAGVVSQWYFAEEGERGNMSIMKSLGFALSSSFGSLVLSSLILTSANIIRRMSQWLAKQAEEENARCKWLAVCLSCLIGFIAHIIEWVTDFATVRMAITGESFFTAGKKVVVMMTQNLINAYAIWWFPPIVLFVCSFLMSMSVSVVLALAARNTWDDDGDLHNVRAWSWYLFIIAFILMMSILHFFSTLLIDAVNAIFVCFAIDRENKTEKNHKAHEVFMSLGVISSPLAAEGATPTA